MTQYWMEHQRPSQAGCVSCTHLQSLFFFLQETRYRNPVTCVLGESETALTSTGLPIICRTDPVMAFASRSIECSRFGDLAYANPAHTLASSTTYQPVGGPTAPQWWIWGDLTLSTHLPARHKSVQSPLWPLPSTSNLHSSHVGEHMPDVGWVGGGLQSSFSPVMTTRLPLVLEEKSLWG